MISVSCSIVNRDAETPPLKGVLFVSQLPGPLGDLPDLFIVQVHDAVNDRSRVQFVLTAEDARKLALALIPAPDGVAS